ncbi:hypothetical protein H4R20_002259 [Coemansia guatemalensis]|uniref:Sulfite oxidase n=1 Tax=Coemansia guatemalensis TaxID=2761395 RepID=A0A9W8LTS3_9FUNG|nr:hypothetical protein H4R20_002259 [Coemansia guatemalensis]
MASADAYADEPWGHRHLPNFIVRSKEPFNAEACPDRLVDSFITPTEQHFRRNHGPIPNIDAQAWSMSIEINAESSSVAKVKRTLRLDDLSKLPQFEVVAVLECAGNRRDGLKAIKPVNGVTWGAGTASNARWGGCRLRDVLAAAGVPAHLCDPFYANPRHVEFAAYGEVTDDEQYASSIPLEWAMNPLNMVLVATEMNGMPLLRDHGFPARIVAPGIIGARWVKWLKYIRVQDRESDGYYQQRDYKILPPIAGASNCEEFWPRFPALMEMNIQSAICRPTADECLQIGRPYRVRGYALTGGGRAVDRVEVSLDGGRTWNLADMYTMQTKADSRSGQRDWTAKHWAWVLWSFRIESVPPNCTIACRAWDSGGNTQPSAAVWNYRGVMNNSVFHVHPPTTGSAPSRL